MFFLPLISVDLRLKHLLFIVYVSRAAMLHLSFYVTNSLPNLESRSK